MKSLSKGIDEERLKALLADGAPKQASGRGSFE
jgi:hypothetical protein